MSEFMGSIPETIMAVLITLFIIAAVAGMVVDE